MFNCLTGKRRWQIIFFNLNFSYCICSKWYNEQPSSWLKKKTCDRFCFKKHNCKRNCFKSLSRNDTRTYIIIYVFCYVLFNRPVMSNYLWSHILQHARPLSLTISWSLPKFMSIASDKYIYCPMHWIHTYIYQKTNFVEEFLTQYCPYFWTKIGYNWSL